MQKWHFLLEVSILACVVRLEPHSLVQWTWMRKRAAATLPGQVDLLNPGTRKQQPVFKGAGMDDFQAFPILCKDFVHHHPTELANHLYKMVGHQVPGIDNIVHGNCCDTLDFFRSLAQRHDLTE